MNQARLKYLMSKYVANTISKSELAEFLAGMEETALDDMADLIAYSPKELDDLVVDEYSLEIDQGVGFTELKKQIDSQSVDRNMFSSLKVKIAIAALSFSMLGLFLYQVRETTDRDTELHADIRLPDNNEATVTLADGTSYSLLHTSDDVLAEEGLQLVRADDGELIFKVSETAEGEVVHRTFNSPKGTSSRLVLSDGSVVWLNSAASITYPSRFSKESRQVKLEGEAFFEVSHREKHPFFVEAGKTIVKVLGTDFNVATDIIDNKVLTTLVSGSVEVSTPNSKKLIKPGVQSVSDELSGELVNKTVDVSEVLAWKDGYFQFNDDDIRAVFDKIKSWYAIEGYAIEGVTKDRFTGTVKRTQKLSELLAQLEKISSYKFKVTEGRVIAMN